MNHCIIPIKPIMITVFFELILILSLFNQCTPDNTSTPPYIDTYDTTTKTYHIKVALCDNENQGIVPVSGQLGNGQVPRYNLYWGTSHGTKTYFKNSAFWKLIKTYQVNDTILERIIFKHHSKDIYLVADAYDGRYIKAITIDFLNAAAGIHKDTLHVDDKTIGIHGNAQLVAYLGHNGLMDFTLEDSFENHDQKERDVIILACYSRDYFAQYIQDAGAHPLVWTSGLMAPEAYTIHDALTSYTNKQSEDEIVLSAAKAYARYQKCSVKAAQNLIIGK